MLARNFKIFVTFLKKKGCIGLCYYKLTERIQHNGCLFIVYVYICCSSGSVV